MDDKDSASDKLSVRERMERKMTEAAAKGAATSLSEEASRPRYSRHLDFIRIAPPTLQVVMLSVIETADGQSKSVIKAGEAYETYLNACKRWSINSILPIAYRSYLAELDLYDLLRYPREQQAAGFRTRRIWLKLPRDIFAEIHAVLLKALNGRIESHGSHASSNQFGNQQDDSTR